MRSPVVGQLVPHGHPAARHTILKPVPKCLSGVYLPLPGRRIGPYIVDHRRQFDPAIRRRCSCSNRLEVFFLIPRYTKLLIKHFGNDVALVGGPLNTAAPMFDGQLTQSLHQQCTYAAAPEFPYDI
jgi:hypothetical protein